MKDFLLKGSVFISKPYFFLSFTEFCNKKMISTKTKQMSIIKQVGSLY